MNKALTVVWGIGIIAVLATGSIILRPVWMKFREPFNSTITNMGESVVTELWNRVDSTINNSFWMIFIVGIFIVLGWIYMSVQQREYQTVGYYK